MLTTDLIEDAAGLEPWVERWDRLAIELEQPYCTPSWMLAWWRHAVTGTAKLRTVVVSDGDELVGIAPYFAQVESLGRVEYRILGAGQAHRIAPLAKPGREEEVASAMAEAFSRARPRPSRFLMEALDAASPWPDLLRRAWPGALRPGKRATVTMAAPTLRLEGTDYESWYESRSSNFRQKMRQKRRQMERRGGEIRMVTEPAEVELALDAMFRLHRERWAERGLEGSLHHGVEEHLRDVVAQLLPSERARLWAIVADGEVVCVHLFFIAGRGVASWGGGFDPAWKDVSPAQLAILAAVEDLWARGERRLDWGGGPLDYKLRFSDGDEPIAWVSLMPKTARYPLTQAQLLPQTTRFAIRGLARRLPDPALERIRDLRRRVGRG
jgi:CelD/BcsL family acetyltransferase involved in cellulose biosynthesis